VTQVWYPVKSSDINLPGVQPSPLLLSPIEFTPNNDINKVLQEANMLADIQTYINAPILPSSKPFPVLLYNPGGGNARFMSHFVVQQLVSNGFVVFGLEHFGDSPADHLPDGTLLTLDNPPLTNNPFLNLSDPLANYTAVQVIMELNRMYGEREYILLPVNVADNEFVIQKIKELNKQDPFWSSRLNVEKFGALGWSYGGATSIDLLVNNPLVTAAIDLDGQFFGHNKEIMNTEKPFLLFHGDIQPPSGSPGMKEALQFEISVIEQMYEDFYKRSSGTRFRSHVIGTNHGSFSDWLLFDTAQTPGPIRDQILKTSKIIINTTIAFFQRYFLCDLSVDMPTYPSSEVDFSAAFGFDPCGVFTTLKIIKAALKREDTTQTAVLQ